MTLQELLTYWQVIRKRLWLIALLVGATVGTILLASLLAKPIYRTITSFQVTTPLPTEVLLVSDFRSTTTRDELAFTRTNFLDVLKSEFIANEVVGQLELPISADELTQQVVIEAPVDSDFVQLRVTASDPKQAADIANALVNTAAKYFAQMSAASFTVNKDVIRNQLEMRKNELDAIRTKLIDFQIENKIGSLDGVLTDQERLITNAKANRDDAMAQGKLDVAASYDRIIAKREQELQERVRLFAGYNDLLVTLNRLEKTYENLLDKQIEAELKETVILSAQFVRVIPARAPSKPLPQMDIRIIFIGLAVSLAAGIILAFVLEALQGQRAKTTEERRPLTVFQPSYDPGKD